MDDYYILKTRTFLENEVELVTTKLENEKRNLNRGLKERSQNTGYKYTITDNKFTILYSSQELPKKGSPNRLQRYLINEIRGIDNHPYYGKVLRERDDKSDVTIAQFINNTYYIIITKPLDQLIESATIANSLIIFTGVITLLIGMLLSYLLSRRVVKPILEITGISKEISNLNFSRKFTSNSQDEISILGDSINKISEKLGCTIRDLQNEMELQKRFLASVSHELKTPISLIRGYSESLTMDIDTSDREEFRSIIIEESDRLNLLMNDLILLMKLDSTSFKLTKSKFDLIQTYSKVLSRYHGNSVHLSSPEYLLVNADEKRLIQVMTNLLDNAHKYCSTNGKITLSIFKEMNSVKILLFNNCDPIPEDQLIHLFDPFYSVDSSRNRDKTGTGLGLSIVQSIIERHEGSCKTYYKDEGIYIEIKLPINL